MSKKNDRDYEDNEEDYTRGPSSKRAEQKRKLEASMQGYEFGSMTSDVLDCFADMHIGEDGNPRNHSLRFQIDLEVPSKLLEMKEDFLHGQSIRYDDALKQCNGLEVIEQDLVSFDITQPYQIL